MLYACSCTHAATAGVKGLIKYQSLLDIFCIEGCRVTGEGITLFPVITVAAYRIKSVLYK